MRRKLKIKNDIFYEIFLALVIIVLILVPQLVGTTTVTDDSQGLNEDGCPVTSTRLEDLEAPGTRFGILTINEWEEAVIRRFPEGKLCQYNSMANTYEALEAGEVDAAMGFLDERQTLASTHPNLALIEEPFAGCSSQVDRADD